MLIPEFFDFFGEGFDVAHGQDYSKVNELDTRGEKIKVGR